jgi:two-component system OmpR family response regulator
MQDSRVTKPLPVPVVATATRKRILIIEDDTDQRNALAQRLRFEGYDALHAADVPAGLRQARINKPDLIILDLGLPGGDGYLVVERLKAIPELSTIPIIVISARDATYEKTRALIAGAFAYYQKPIANVALRSALLHGLQS